MRTQAWLPDGTLISDEELTLITGVLWHHDHITGHDRLATPAEAATIPRPLNPRLTTILAQDPRTITCAELLEAIRLLAHDLGHSAELINDTPSTPAQKDQP